MKIFLLVVMAVMAVQFLILAVELRAAADGRVMEIFGSPSGRSASRPATLLMFAMLLLLLVTGIPLAFVTLLVALIFALGWFGPMAVPLITSRGLFLRLSASSSSRCRCSC